MQFDHPDPLAPQMRADLFEYLTVHFILLFFRTELLKWVLILVNPDPEFFIHTLILFVQCRYVILIRKSCSNERRSMRIRIRNISSTPWCWLFSAGTWSGPRTCQCWLSSPSISSPSAPGPMYFHTRYIPPLSRQLGETGGSGSASKGLPSWIRDQIRPLFFDIEIRVSTVVKGGLNFIPTSVLKHYNA